MSRLQFKHAVLEMFVREGDPALSARMARYVKDHITDEEIVNSPLKRRYTRNLRSRCNNLLLIKSGLAAERTYTRGDA